MASKDLGDRLADEHSGFGSGHVRKLEAVHVFLFTAFLARIRLLAFFTIVTEELNFSVEPALLSGRGCIRLRVSAPELRVAGPVEHTWVGLALTASVVDEAFYAAFSFRSLNIDTQPPTRTAMVDRDEQFQARANALEMRLFHKRVKHPGETLARFRSKLQAIGLTRVMASWHGAGARFQARVGMRLARRLRQTAQEERQEIVYARVLSAARRIGFEAGIEDCGVCLNRRNVSGHVSGVPFAVMTAALDKLWLRSRARNPELDPVGT